VLLLPEKGSGKHTVSCCQTFAQPFGWRSQQPPLGSVGRRQRLLWLCRCIPGEAERRARGSFVLHGARGECDSSTPVLAGSSAAASLATGRNRPRSRFSGGCCWPGHGDKRCHLLQTLTVLERECTVHGWDAGHRAESPWPAHCRILPAARVRLDITKKFFTLGKVRLWHRLPREAVAAPSLAVFKARLDEALRNLIWWKRSLPMAGGRNWMIHKVPSNPNHSDFMILSQY